MTGCAFSAHGKLKGRFTGTISDIYEWDKRGLGGNFKQLGSEIISGAYHAATVLEQNFGYHTFENVAEFTDRKPFVCD